MVRSYYEPYRSSLDPSLILYASVTPASTPAPMLLVMHGWHGNVKSGHRDNVDPPHGGAFTAIAPEMRGRGDSAGSPDANGYELQDAVDALEACRARFPEAVDPAAAPRLAGGSGGGGNALGLLGKFPDLFSTAVYECGVSDYARWYAGDGVGEFRDELEGAGWIGGTPATNPEGYLSRGGLTTAMNLRTPLLMLHGDEDARVPVEQTLLYIEAAKAHGRGDLIQSIIFPGVGRVGHYGGLDAAGEERRKKAIAAHLREFTRLPELEPAGQLVVAGFLRTRRFSVDLETASQVALLHYDLDRKEFRLEAPSCRVARVRDLGDGRVRSVQCAQIRLAEFCERIGVPHPASLMAPR